MIDAESLALEKAVADYYDGVVATLETVRDHLREAIEEHDPYTAIGGFARDLLAVVDGAP